MEHAGDFRSKGRQAVITHKCEHCYHDRAHTEAQHAESVAETMRRRECAQKGIELLMADRLAAVPETKEE